MSTHPEVNPAHSDLVRKALANEPLALDRVLLAYADRLTARIDRRLPADIRATCSPDDVLQDVFADAFGRVPQFKLAEGCQDAGEAFFGWLATIADHKVIDVVRAHRAAKRGGGLRLEQGGVGGSHTNSVASLIELLAVHDRTPSRSVTGHEAAKAVLDAMQSLYPEYRQAIELRFLMGLSPAEVAQRMGRTEHAVHNLCNRAMTALREAVGDLSRFMSRP